jgi:HicB family
MTALTLRLPEHKHQRLRAYAQERGTSLNRLIEDLTTQALIEFDVETRFKLRAKTGLNQEALGLSLLQKAMT